MPGLPPHWYFEVAFKSWTSLTEDTSFKFLVLADDVIIDTEVEVELAGETKQLNPHLYNRHGHCFQP